MTVEARQVALHDKAARLAFRHYLCSGRVPLEVREVLAATESLAALEKYDPNQPRVPRGSPEGGRWTDDDRWFDPANPPGVDLYDYVQDELEIAIDFSLKKFGVPKDAWRQVE